MKTLYEQLLYYIENSDQNENHFSILKTLEKKINKLPFKEKNKQNIEHIIQSTIISIILMKEIKKLETQYANVNFSNLEEISTQSIANFNNRKNSCVWKIFNMGCKITATVLIDFVLAFTAVHVIAEQFVDYKHPETNAWDLEKAFKNFTSNYTGMTTFAQLAYPLIFFTGVAIYFTPNIPERLIFKREETNLKILNNLITLDENFINSVDDKNSYNVILGFCEYISKKRETTTRFQNEINTLNNDEQQTSIQLEETDTFQVNANPIETKISEITTKHSSKINTIKPDSVIEFISSVYKELENELFKT